MFYRVSNGGSSPLVYSNTFSGSAYTTEQSVRITVNINTGIKGLAHPVVALNNVILGPYQATVYANATVASYVSATGVITITSEQIYSGNDTVTITGTVYLFDT